MYPKFEGVSSWILFNILSTYESAIENDEIAENNQKMKTLDTNPEEIYFELVARGILVENSDSIYHTET